MQIFQNNMSALDDYKIQGWKHKKRFEQLTRWNNQNISDDET